MRQAEFARFSGYTVQQVNKFCRGRAKPPFWAVAMLSLMARHRETAESAERAVFQLIRSLDWREVLGIDLEGPPQSITSTAVRRAMTGLAKKYHPDVGGSDAVMTRITAAYEVGRRVCSK